MTFPCPRIPQELVTLVFSFCDRDTLTSTCRVAHRFLQDSRAQLYRHIWLDNARADQLICTPAYCFQLIKHLEIPKIDLDPCWRTLFCLLAEQAELVTLKIWVHPYGRYHSSFNTSSTNWSFSLALLASPSLTHVELTTRMFPLVVAAQCRSLKYLEIYEDWDRIEAGHVPEHLRPRLSTLSLVNWNIRWTQLRRYVNLDSLTKLSLSGYEEDVLFSEFLQASCSVLQELALWLDYDEDSSSGLGILSWIEGLSFPCLKALTIGLFAFARAPWIEFIYPLISAFVTIAPLLHDVRLYLQFEPKTSAPIEHFAMAPDVDIDERISMLKVYFGEISFWGPRKHMLLSSATKILEEALGKHRQFEIISDGAWPDLTRFCEPLDCLV
ncbi:hypothetical protein DL96DRAFT_124613 [Flagelloscypha sp. PMI_526]|nr:hypothetical protein DL96DRAFT_124613 [Flagelloscypha sp. PMI_526]